MDINMINNYSIFRDASIGLNWYYTAFGCEYPLTVLDIGAHYGGLCCEAIDNGAEFMMAIEADRANYEQLEANIEFLKKHEDFDSILFHAAFCGDKCDEYIDLICSMRGNTGQRSIMYSPNSRLIKDINEIENVKVIKLRDIISILKLKGIKIIDYFKIDIEGAEFEALPMNDESKEFLKMVRFIDIKLHSLNNADYFDNKYDIDIYSPKAYRYFLRDCGFEINLDSRDYKIIAKNLSLKQE